VKPQELAKTRAKYRKRHPPGTKPLNRQAQKLQAARYRRQWVVALMLGGPAHAQAVVGPAPAGLEQLILRVESEKAAALSLCQESSGVTPPSD
jgi:hypothetical protein